ncbi:MAG: hypothetical protein AB7E47_09440 [Desulfovibrionaceae bacterium]
MIDLDITALIQLVNFIVTLVVLNLLLVKPIRGVIRKRAEQMAGLAKEADGFASSAEEKVKKYEAALDDARAKAAVEREALKAAGLEKEKDILGAANAAAATTLGAAREDVVKQVKSAKESLMGQVVPLAEKAAGKLLG